MNKKIVRMVALTMFFSVVLNTNLLSVAEDTVNILNASSPNIIFSNIENSDTNIPIDQTITITFDKNIKFGSGNIELFNMDRSKVEKVDVSTNGNILVIKPINKMVAGSRYILTLEEASIIDLNSNSLKEISYYFATTIEEDDEENNKQTKEINYGLNFGRTLGQLQGYIDSLNNKKNNWEKALPSGKDIINEYNLNKETYEYRIIFLEEFQKGFKKGYEEAFRSESFDIILNSHNEGKEQGEFFGALLGEIHGRRDFYNNRSNDWERWLPSESTIIKDYNLTKDNDAYLESFIKGFKNEYKINYTSSFRLTSVEGEKIIKENGLNHGRSIGKLAGLNQGKLDYISGRNNDWKFYLPSDLEIINTYNLNREASEYKEGFLVGYKDSFKEGYVSSFQNNNLEVAEGNLNSTLVSMKGGEVDSFNKAMKLKIDPGTFYEETAITIEKTPISNLSSYGTITPATHSYNIKMKNLINYVNLKKPIRIEFQYYGSSHGGIYELKNGEWVYLYSKIDGNKIFTDIKDDKYAGGTYAVFIDEGYEALDDIKGHWAEEAAEVLLKRGYISGYSDKTFRPDQSITRAEFIKILDNMYNWEQYYGAANINNSSFRDSMIFGIYSNSISRAVSLGYISGYSDNTFRPNISITYQEVEWIIQRITGKTSFKWDTVAENILNEHYVRSKSYNSKQNYITRAEITYLLYFLDQGWI